MKKRVLCLLFAILTILALRTGVFASGPKLDYITDTAGLLTEEQNLQLEELAADQKRWKQMNMTRNEMERGQKNVEMYTL